MKEHRLTPFFLLLVATTTLVLIFGRANAVAEWSNYIDLHSVRLHRLSKTEILVVGNSARSNEICSNVYNTDGVVVNSSCALIEPNARLIASFLTEDGGLLVFGRYKQRNLLFAAHFASPLRLDRQDWLTSYEGLRGYMFFSNTLFQRRRSIDAKATNASSTYLLIGMKHARNITLTEIETGKGEVGWNGEFYLLWRDGDTILLEKTKEEEIVMAVTSYFGSTLLFITPNRSVELELNFDAMEITCMREMKDGLVVGGGVHMDGIVIMRVFKFGKDKSILWTLDVPVSGPNALIMPEKILKTTDGDYVLAGELRYHANGCVHLIGVTRNGTIAWRKMLNGSGKIIGIVELHPREYVVLVYYGAFKLIKYTLPEHVELLHVHNHSLDEYRGCPMGHYWNYTECIHCPAQCSSCLTELFCTSCARGYVLIRDHNTCVMSRRPHKNDSSVPPCNCSAECSSRNCSSAREPPVRYCQFEDDSTVTPAIGCKCPPESLATETRCVKLTAKLCPPLCQTCTAASSRSNPPPEIYCVECAKLPRTMTHRTGKLFVDCRCEFGYAYNGSTCEREANDTHVSSGSKKGGAISVVLLLFLGIAIAGAAGGVAWILGRRRRKRARAQVPGEDASVGVVRLPGAATASATELTETSTQK